MTRMSCPRCRCELEASVGWNDDGDERVTLTAVPLTEQPCAPVLYGTVRPPADYYDRVWAPSCEPRPWHRRGSRCNWLQSGRRDDERYNDPSHVTPCYAYRWTIYRPTMQPFYRFLVNGRSVSVSAGLARCVQGPKA